MIRCKPVWLIVLSVINFMLLLSMGLTWLQTDITGMLHVACKNNVFSYFCDRKQNALGGYATSFVFIVLPSKLYTLSHLAETNIAIDEHNDEHVPVSWLTGSKNRCGVHNTYLKLVRIYTGNACQRCPYQTIYSYRYSVRRTSIDNMLKEGSHSGHIYTSLTV